MSVRAVGEGHLSSIEFRTGVRRPRDGDVRSTTRPAPTPGRPASRTMSRSFAPRAFGRSMPSSIATSGRRPRAGCRREFDRGRPRARPLAESSATAADPAAARRGRIDRIRAIAASQLRRRLPPERPADRAGALPGRPGREPRARGRPLRPLRRRRRRRHLLRAPTPPSTAATSRRSCSQTADFQRFRRQPLDRPGRAEQGHGALPAPRRRALSSRCPAGTGRATRIADVRRRPPLGRRGDLQTPRAPWELIQLGNCGSPIETDAGWLVLTHGVGPMREYAIGAMLLDLDDPTSVIGQLAEPLLTPDETNATATCPTSSTPAVRCGTATPWCCRTAAATRRSGSGSSIFPGSWIASGPDAWSVDRPDQPSVMAGWLARSR